MKPMNSLRPWTPQPKASTLTGNLQVTLTDTVGFYPRSTNRVGISFKSTLEESKNVDLLVHVIDASDP